MVISRALGTPGKILVLVREEHVRPHSVRSYSVPALPRDRRPPTADRRPPTANRQPPTAHCRRYKGLERAWIEYASDLELEHGRRCTRPADTVIPPDSSVVRLGRSSWDLSIHACDPKATWVRAATVGRFVPNPQGPRPSPWLPENTGKRFGRPPHSDTLLNHRYVIAILPFRPNGRQ